MENQNNWIYNQLGNIVGTSIDLELTASLSGVSNTTIDIDIDINITNSSSVQMATPLASNNTAMHYFGQHDYQVLNEFKNDLWSNENPTYRYGNFPSRQGPLAIEPNNLNIHFNDNNPLNNAHRRIQVEDPTGNMIDFSDRTDPQNPEQRLLEIRSPRPLDNLVADFQYSRTSFQSVEVTMEIENNANRQASGEMLRFDNNRYVPYSGFDMNTDSRTYGNPFDGYGSSSGISSTPRDLQQFYRNQLVSNNDPLLTSTCNYPMTNAFRPQTRENDVFLKGLLGEDSPDEGPKKRNTVRQKRQSKVPRSTTPKDKPKASRCPKTCTVTKPEQLANFADDYQAPSCSFSGSPIATFPDSKMQSKNVKKRSSANRKQRKSRAKINSTAKKADKFDTNSSSTDNDYLPNSAWNNVSLLTDPNCPKGKNSKKRTSANSGGSQRKPSPTVTKLDQFCTNASSRMVGTSYDSPLNNLPVVTDPSCSKQKKSKKRSTANRGEPRSLGTPTSVMDINEPGCSWNKIPIILDPYSIKRRNNTKKREATTPIRKPRKSRAKPTCTVTRPEQIYENNSANSSATNESEQPFYWNDIPIIIESDTDSQSFTTEQNQTGCSNDISQADNQWLNTVVKDEPIIDVESIDLEALHAEPYTPKCIHGIEIFPPYSDALRRSEIIINQPFSGYNTFDMNASESDDTARSGNREKRPFCKRKLNYSEGERASDENSSCKNDPCLYCQILNEHDLYNQPSESEKVNQPIVIDDRFVKQCIEKDNCCPYCELLWFNQILNERDLKSKQVAFNFSDSGTNTSRSNDSYEFSEVEISNTIINYKTTDSTSKLPICNDLGNHHYSKLQQMKPNRSMNTPATGDYLQDDIPIIIVDDINEDFEYEEIPANIQMNESQKNGKSILEVFNGKFAGLYEKVPNLRGVDGAILIVGIDNKDPVYYIDESLFATNHSGTGERLYLLEMNAGHDEYQYSVVMGDGRHFGVQPKKLAERQICSIDLTGPDNTETSYYHSHF